MPERRVGDAPIQNSTPGSVEVGNEMSFIDSWALTKANEASAFDESQLAAAGCASDFVASRRHLHAHVIRKTGGVISSGSGSVGKDAVELYAAAP